MRTLPDALWLRKRADTFCELPIVIEDASLNCSVLDYRKKAVTERGQCGNELRAANRFITISPFHVFNLIFHPSFFFEFRFVSCFSLSYHKHKERAEHPILKPDAVLWLTENSATPPSVRLSGWAGISWNRVDKPFQPFLSANIQTYPSPTPFLLEYGNGRDTFPIPSF